MYYLQPILNRNTLTFFSFVLICILTLTSVSAGTYPKEAVAWRGTTPVLDGYISPGEWDDEYIAVGDVIKMGNIYYLFYTSIETGLYQIGLARTMEERASRATG